MAIPSFIRPSWHWKTNTHTHAWKLVWTRRSCSHSHVCNFSAFSSPRHSGSLFGSEQTHLSMLFHALFEARVRACVANIMAHGIRVHITHNAHVRMAEQIDTEMVECAPRSLSASVCLCCLCWLCVCFYMSGFFAVIELYRCVGLYTVRPIRKYTHYMILFLHSYGRKLAVSPVCVSVCVFMVAGCGLRCYRYEYK